MIVNNYIPPPILMYFRNVAILIDEENNTNNPYDIVPLIPIIEKTGGIVTTLDGKRAERGGAVVASGCPILHEQVLAILNNG